MVSYDLFVFTLKIEASTRGTNSVPFRVFGRNHLPSSSGIICGAGSFAVQVEDHFRLGDHLQCYAGFYFGVFDLKEPKL